MRILINHLTRMRPGRICVAGVTTNGAHIRPVLDGEQLGRDLLSSEGGPFSLGQVVDLGKTRSRQSVPEVEDVVFRPEEVKPEKMLSSAEFGDVMKQFAKSSLVEIFGKDLIPHRRTAAVSEGEGSVSLGVLRPEGARFSSGTPQDGGVRLTVEDTDLGDLTLPVTDLRLWKPDHRTPARRAVEGIRSALEGCLVAVGLSRPFRPPGHSVPRHWLQVNNLFPVGDPLWARA